MAREFAKIKSAIWQDDDFRQLPPSAQHLYFVILTDPDLSYCGVGDWRPRRMLPKSAGWSIDDLHAAGAALTERRLLIVDEDTEEVLVRSFLRHDGVMQHNKLCVSAALAFASVASNTLRGVIVHELRRLREEFPEWPTWERQQVQEVLKRNAIDPASATPLAPGVGAGVAPGVAPGVGANAEERLGVPYNSNSNSTITTATETSSLKAPAAADAPKRGTRIPEDFAITDEMREWAAEHLPGLDVDALLGEFVDYWRGVSGSKGVKLDWVATWRNGMRKRWEWVQERGGATSAVTRKRSIEELMNR